MKTETKKIKLSDKQKEVIRLMREGYELGHSTGWVANTWLQLGGCGRGGKTADCNYKTFDALWERKLISELPNQHIFTRPKRYELTELGKTIEL